jgi:hypothetical protein
MTRKVTNGVTETQDDAILDIQIDVTVGDMDTLNDLSCIHMGDTSRFVGVAVSSDDIGDAAV